MKRLQVTTMIKAIRGSIWAKNTNSTNYLIPITDEKLLELREKIPFNTGWHGKFMNKQSLIVFFNEPIFNHN